MTAIPSSSSSGSAQDPQNDCNSKVSYLVGITMEDILLDQYNVVPLDFSKIQQATANSTLPQKKSPFADLETIDSPFADLETIDGVPLTPQEVEHELWRRMQSNDIVFRKC